MNTLPIDFLIKKLLRVGWGWFIYTNELSGAWFMTEIDNGWISK